MPCSPMVNANFILLPGVTKEKIRESIYRDPREKTTRESIISRCIDETGMRDIWGSFPPSSTADILPLRIKRPFERLSFFWLSFVPVRKVGQRRKWTVFLFFFFFRKYSGMIVEWSTYRQERSFERRLISYFSRSFNFDRRRIRGRVTYH